MLNFQRAYSFEMILVKRKGNLLVSIVLMRAPASFILEEFVVSGIAKEDHST